MTTINRWLGLAQARAEERVLIPMNVTPGSVWLLRVGALTYSYTYPPDIEVDNLTEADKMKSVVDGLIEAYENAGTALGGGSDGTSLSLNSTLYQGKWSLMAQGSTDGVPIDVSLTVQDPTAGYVTVIELQKGQASRNEIQRIKWPKTPTGGTIRLEEGVTRQISFTVPAVAGSTQYAFKFVINGIGYLTSSFTTAGSPVGNTVAAQMAAAFPFLVSTPGITLVSAVYNAGPANYTLTVTVSKSGEMFLRNVTTATDTSLGVVAPTYVNEPLAYNASAADVEDALEAVHGVGNVGVTGSYTAGYLVEFKGALAGIDQEPITAYSVDAVGVAAYTTTVTRHAGVGRKTYILDKLNGNAGSSYRFAYDDSEGHLFTGAADAAAIQVALESVPKIGAGNVTAVPQDDNTILITMVGKFVGSDADDLTVESDDGSTAPGLTGSSGDTVAVTTQQSITIHNMPLSGNFYLIIAGVKYGPISYATVSVGSIAGVLPAGWSIVPPVTGSAESGPVTIVLAYQSTMYDAPLVTLDVSGLIGTYAIDVGTIQTAKTPRNEVQQVAIATDPTGGTFTLQFGANTTAGLAYNASAATIQTALQGLASVGGGNALVSGPDGGPWLVEFTGTLAASDKSAIIGNGTSLTLSNVGAVTVVQVVNPTGPNWWNNKANWSQNAVPNGDHIATFENGKVSCRYGLQSIPAFAGMDIYRTYTGSIGQPTRKENGTPETLPTDLELTDNGGVFVLRVGLGDDGNGPSVVRIKAGAQNVQATVLYTQESNDLGYVCELSGNIDELIAGSANIGIAVQSGSTATVGRIRCRPSDRDAAKIEWGELADVGSVTVQGGVVRAGSVPSALFVTGGDVTVRGVGDIDALSIRGVSLRWLAGGKIGKQGTITSLALDGDDQAQVISLGHGLTSGARVFVRGFTGVQGLPDGFYTVNVIDANTFVLVGTAPEIPYGALNPTTVSWFYQSGTAEWGLADSVIIGEEALIDMSELSTLRTIVAPVVLQAQTSQFIDPLVTVKKLRMRHNPGPLEESMGVGCVMLRDERSAASAQPGNPSGAGGLAAS